MSRRNCPSEICPGECRTPRTTSGNIQSVEKLSTSAGPARLLSPSLSLSATFFRATWQRVLAVHQVIYDRVARRAISKR